MIGDEGAECIAWLMTEHESFLENLVSNLCMGVGWGWDYRDSSPHTS